ncbi:OB-fold nucleic acid binding domain-containing protein [Actinomyces sp. MRS3W]|uniref:OB-fold nucleic acid binding domain-containing protein n=1 Tax=Actinomyces sp. MRS3W TaxID=2800796 RepID=UPI0028FDAD30|nr:OB-fold nucleic acid binding domain-containing protein [Actinomyces sp. MRS3W]MDU0347541.1 OB-fold nucleic acid binding domain-containing protein [Actinomyces sp. MRS3W]
MSRGRRGEHSLGRRLAARLRSLRASREDINAADEADSAARRGATFIEDLQPRHRARVTGVLRAITYRPASDKPMLVGQLYDGTGSVDLVWIGRRAIAGINPGIHVSAEGMVVAGRSRPTIYNPVYEILGEGT